MDNKEEPITVQVCEETKKKQQQTLCYMGL